MTTTTRRISIVSAPPKPQPGKVNKSDYQRIAASLDFPAHKEQVAVMYLGDRGVKVTRFIPSKGNTARATFDIGAIIRRARVLRATGIVVTHNHPSGELRASPDDIQTTQDLADAGAKAGIPLVDHLIYANGEAKSVIDQMATVADIGEHTREHYRGVHALAREIRRSGEKYSSALKRAWAQTKEQPDWNEDSPEPAEPTADNQGKPQPVSGKSSAGNGIGNATTATGPDPSKVYEFRYRILPFEIVEPSHTDALDPNPRYPRELQPRLRDRAASRLQIRTMAQNLDPKALILDFHTLDRGPMIVGPDEGQGFPVESGNGRTLALRLAQQDFPDKFQEYQDLLRESVEQYGIDPDHLEQIDNPVLVRERLTQVDRVAFAEEANASTAMQMSPLEVALTDAKKLSDEALATLEVGESQSVDQALQSPGNNSLVSGWLDKLPANERAALVDQAGRLNQVGLQRLKAAIFAKVYPGDAGVRLTRAFIESLDPTLKNVEAAMFDSLPQMARAEGMIRSGQRIADLTIGQDLAEVVDKLAALKQQRIPAADYIRQATFTVRDLTPSQEKMLVHLEQFGRSRKVLREFLRGYADAVINSPHPQQGAMFVTAQESKGDIIARLIESQTKKASTGALFELIEARERAGLVADPGRRFPRWSMVRAERP